MQNNLARIRMLLCKIKHSICQCQLNAKILLNLPVYLISHSKSSLQYQQCHTIVTLDSIAYTKLAQFSIKSDSLIHGKLAHTHMVITAFKPCLFLLNNLLNMYCKFGEMRIAQKLFDQMPDRTVISYNVMISGYCEVGFYSKAIGLFREARLACLMLDKFSYAGVLSACGQIQNLCLGKLIHGLAVVFGLAKQVFLTNLLIDMYCKCGRINKARLLFDCSFELDNVSWNSLISGYARIGDYDEILKLLVKMNSNGLRLNAFTLGSALKACYSNVSNMIVYGKALHGYTIKFGLNLDIVVGTALLDMYAKTGNLGDAVEVFMASPHKNVLIYNAMIAAFIQVEDIDEALAFEAFNLLSLMRKQGIKPSPFTFSSIVKICNRTKAFEYGKQIHAQICKNNFQSDEFIGSTLIELYSLLGSSEDQLKCFSSTPKLDIVLWTSMITGYAQMGLFKSALAIFCELLGAGIKPDEFIISTMLGACADLGADRSGEQVQGYGIKSGIGIFTAVQNSQISMYSKSGSIDSAKMTFEEIKNPDVVSWSILIGGAAQHGCAKDALNLFEMMKSHKVQPNEITFLGVLTACSHGGLVEEGLRYYESMKKETDLKINVEHCACVVDLLSRAGKLLDAEYFILNSGFKEDPVMWRPLLSGCRVYKDIDTGKRVAHELIRLDPHNSSSYVLLYNIYAEAGLDSPAVEIRHLMKDRGVKKEPGQSW